MSIKTALCLALLAAPAGALAQPIDLIPGALPPGMEEEAKGPPPEQLFISPAGEPFRAGPGAAYPVGAWFAQADADHDGALTREEFAADHMAFFTRLDVNGDDEVDGFEDAAYEKNIAPEVRTRTSRGLRGAPRKGGWFRRARPDMPQREGAGLYGLINEPLPVRAADANFDYRVTREETAAAAERRFALLDRDKNGRLTLAELPKTPAQVIAENRPKPPPQDRDDNS